MTHEDATQGLSDDELNALVAEAVAELGRVCPVCGRSFVPRQPHGVYCCTAHRVLAWQRRRKARAT